MRELWQISGPYYSLPVWIEWVDSQTEVAMVRVGAGVHLMEIQHAAVKELFAQIGVYRANGHWWMRRDLLDRYCQKAPEGEDPQNLVEWRPWHRTVKYRTPPSKQTRARLKNRDEFFHEFCKLGWLKDPLHAELLFDAFAKHAMHWILNEQKPVSFGFFELHAVPYRQNWKELAFAYCRKQKVSLDKVDLQKLVPILLDARLSAYNTAKRAILWHLEAKPMQPWWRFSLEYEKQRARNPLLKRELWAYAKDVYDTWRRRLPTTLRLFAGYCALARRPYLEIRPFTQARRTLPAASVRERGDTGLPRHTDGDTPAADLRTGQPIAGIPVGGPAADALLPQMPDIRPEASDLRAAWEDQVDAPGDETA